MSKVKKHNLDNELKTIIERVENDASTSQKGPVQLSNDTDSTSETLAPTMKALNEVKQYANDIKTKVSNVVGAPLTNTDTSDKMVTNIQTIKNILASILTAKGQTSVGTESLNNLVNKVQNISTKPKTASGTVVSPYYTEGFQYRNGSTANLTPIVVTGLDFIPRKILVTTTALLSETVYDLDRGEGYGVTVSSYTANIQNGVVTYNVLPNGGVGYIHGTGFKLPVLHQGHVFRWFASE